MLIQRGTVVRWEAFERISFSGSSNDETWPASRMFTHKEQSCHTLHRCCIAKQDRNIISLSETLTRM